MIGQFCPYHLFNIIIMENRSILTRLLSLLLVAVISNVSWAQTFNPPSSYEDSYPSGGVEISRTTHTSCYSTSNLNLFGSTEDLVVSGWDEPGMYATVAWRRLAPGAPWSIISQGLIPYGPGYKDMEVGFIYVGSSIYIFAAYYKMGSGHYVDIYKLNPGGPSLVSNVPLSSSSSYGRISLDCHRLYGMVVTWEDNAIIKSRVAWDNGGSLSMSSDVIFDPGGVKRFLPDVTFSHAGSTGALLCEYVYLEDNGTNQGYVQSFYDFWTMSTYGSPTVVAPVVQDFNMLSYTNYVYPPNIDCPDHYSVQNWAYTYHTNTSNDIYVRLVDYNSTGTPTTIVVNDGSLGNVPINGSVNINPFLSYANNMNNFYVGWYTSEVDPNTGDIAGYISANVHESGAFLMSAMDYLTVANIPTDASGTPFLSSSKYTEASDYLYTIFPQYDYFTGYEMQHKYHDWTSLSSYKGEVQHYECNDDGRKAMLAKQGNTLSTVAVYPNPFTDQLKISVSADMQNEEVNITVTNITGTVVFQSSGVPSDINKQLNGLSTLNSGIYIMNVDCSATNYSDVIKLQKLD